MIIMSLISLLYQLSFIIAPYHNPNNLYKLHINETKEMKKVTNDELSESDEVKPSKKKGTNAIVLQVYLLYFPKKNTFITQQTNTNKQKYLSFSNNKLELFLTSVSIFLQ